MKDFVALAIVVAALVLFSLTGLAARKRFRAMPGRRAQAGGAPAGGELVAVIAAAVAAASGMEIGSFKVVGIEGPGGSFMQRGFNTPAWGHVDRFLRGE
jgi:hypothetical protein